MDNTQAKQEFDATAEKYGGEDAYNLAKADGRTVLTYKQWVQVRTPSFKKWFGDWENDITTASVVRNPTTSEPQVVYHGTRPNLSGFTVFDTDNEKGNGSIFKDNHGSFFTDKIEVARTYGEDIYPVFLNIKTPDIYNFNGRLWNDYGLVEGRSQNVMYSKNYSETTTTLAYFAKNKQGIDGATFLNVVDMGFGAVFSDKKAMSNVWVVFNPEQIKSATDNIGTFDRQNPDIRFDLFGLPENDIDTMKKDLRIAKCLQGEPVAVLNDRVAPQGIANLRQWAISLFANEFNGQAISPELGVIALNERSVRDTIAHGINPFKAEAFRSIKQVIEQGVIVATTQVGEQDHFFISAPVTIENKEDIVTVLVRKDINSQRMYLHSVITQESLLQKAQEQAKENLLSSKYPKADTEVSKQNGKLRTGDIGRILQKYLKVNISELEKELKIMENQQIEQQTTQPESELKNWIEKNGFQYSFSGIDAKVFLHRDNELIRLIVADDNRNIQLVNTSNIYKKISYDWQNTPENFAKLDNDFQTMKDSFKIIANLNEYTATQGGVFLSKHTENTAKLDLSGQPESVLQYIKMANHPFIDDEPYFNALTPEQQVFVRQYLDSMNNEREQNQTVSNNEIHPDEISWRDEIVYLSLRYEEIDGVSIYHDKGLMNRPLNQLSQVELEDRLNIAEYLLSEAMVRTQDSEVWNDLQKQVNEVQNEMEHRKQQEVQPAAENGGFSLSNPQSEKENTMNTQNDTIFQFSNGYTVVISDYFEQEIKENNGRVDDFTQVYIYHKDRITPVAEYWYSVDCLDSEKWAFNQDSVKSRSEFVLNKENENPTSAMDYVQEPYGHRKSFSVNILGNPNWKEDLARAMVDFAVSYEVKTGLNADKEFSGSPEIVSVVRDNYAAANRYAQNATKNPVFLEKIDNRHQPVMPFDDFVAAVMKDTGDSREEVIAFASEAFRSQYQAADGYLRATHDSGTMFNAFDIEIDGKSYYATAPLEWVKEQARIGLSDRGWDLANARHNFLHSSLENNQWETAFHQLKAAADEYKKWRNQVCAFFNFNQPEITLQQGEWTQVAQFVSYKQEWEQLDNARLLIAEFTPQQALEFHCLYAQYMQYQSLAENNAQQGVDTTHIDKQIAALERSLNEKVAQNLPQTENRQVLFDLFGTQMNLFDENEKTQEQGTGTPEKNNLDDLDELHIKFTNALEELSPEKQAELYPLVRDLGFEFIRLRQDCKELRAGNVEKSLNKIFELQNTIISKGQDYFVKGNDTDLAIEQAEHNHRVLMFVFKAKVGDRDFVEKLNDISYDFYKIIETHYQQTPVGQNDLFKRLDSKLSRLNERLAWLRRNLETEKSFLQQAESGNVAVEVEYHKQTIDSINVGIAKNETEQNKLKLDANGFNQTPESQVLLQQLKEKFPHLWQSETQEQGISASAIPENSQETQPETVSGSIETEKQGTGTPENSDRLPENSKLHFHFDEQLFEKIETAQKRGDEKFRFEDEITLQNLAYIIDENGVGAGVDFEKFISTPYSITDPLSWKERIVCHLVNTDKDTGNLISHYGTYYTIEEDNEDDFYADFSKDNPQLKQQVFKVLKNFLSEKYEYALRLKAEYEKASEKAAERLPENLSLWLKENGFDFESVDSHREVFQKGNLKLAVYNDDGDYTVSLSQFDKNIPVSEIDEKMIEPTRQERIYFFQNTDDLEKLSQYLRAMEQGISMSEIRLQHLLTAKDSELNLADRQVRSLLSWALENGFSLTDKHTPSDRNFVFEKNQFIFAVNDTDDNLFIAIAEEDSNGEINQDTQKTWRFVFAEQEDEEILATESIFESYSLLLQKRGDFLQQISKELPKELMKLEQGISASAISENSQERQPETVSGSPEIEKQGVSASENSDTTPNKAKLIENMNLAQLDIEITKTKEKLSKYQAVIDKVSTTQSEKAKAFPLGVGRDGWSKGRAKQAIQEIEKETKQAVEYADAVKNRDDLQNRLNRLEKAKERLNKPQQEQKEQQNKPVSTLKWRQTQKERHTEKDGYTPKKIESGDFAITGSDGLYSLYFQDEKIGTYYKLSEAKTKAEQIKETTKNSSGSPEIEKQGTTTPEISETVAVSHDLSGQPEKPTSSVLTKEQKAELKAAKDALTVAKKELKAMRDELENTRPHQVSYYLQWKEEKRQAISEKQSEVRERSHQYDELSFAFKTQTGEITDLEKEILTARLSGSLKERFDIAFRELKTQKKEIGVEYDALKLRIENKDFYEFEIQSVMQDAVGFYSGSRGMATLYHKGKPLPLTTDREKAIAYLLQVELPTQLHDELGKPFNALARKIKKLDYAERYIENANGALGRYYGITQKDIDPYIDLLEDTENQLMKGSIEERAEINLTYDINTEYGKQKIRELFYNSRHDQAQAELFEKVFAMAQKLGVEVRHALRDPHKTFSKRNATTTTLGWYQLNENSARVKHGGKIDTEEKGEVLLHELVHSVTSRAMLLKEQGHTELLNPAQVKAIDEIEKIYKIVLDKAEELGFEKYQKVTKDDKETFVGDYGLKNSHEFIAELANPVFREKLKQVAMFDDTVKAMTEVATGVEKTETAYDRLTAALYQIIDNYDIDFGANYEQAKYGNIKMNDIFIEPEQQENTMKISKLYKDEDGFAVNMRQFNDGDYDYSVFYRDTFLKSFRSPEYAIQAIHQNKTALFEQYHRMTYRPSHTENGVTYFTGGFTYLNADRLPEKENQMEQTIQAAESGVFLPENSVKHDMNGLPEKQEQAMKSSQEILAEVMSKYETPIDNKDGLMNRPLHWLSAAELEDRRTVLSCRIDKAIQNSDSKTEERLDLEYINVENEMARRKTLSDNLNKVMRKSQFETLSVREFTVLSESFDELLRQINKYDENSVIREVIRQELVAIRARMDGWKQPETLSIDDKLAMTEQKLRKINMDIDNRVYDYGADDKTVQNYIAYRTELFGDLETLKEQAATQGGVSLDDKNSRHANLFLSATKALLYRDLENAVRWHNHFIEESKEIPVPQSVIDMQTKRIEEYSKELNERLYGDERQKYRDMFPEQIEKIKQDFKKMLENLETSPENSVTQAVDTLSEEEMGAFGFPIAEEERAMAAFDRALNSQTPQEVKQDDFRLPETTEPRLGDKVILQNGVFYPVISRIADEKFSLGRNAPDKDFIDTIKTNGEIPVSVDEYKQIAKMKNELWYCENTKEFVFMGGVENNYVFRNIRNEEYYGLKEFLQQLKDRQPETVKTLNPKEQALEDGKRLNQAAEKVKNAQWECAKKPNDKECYDNLKNALAEQAALNEEIKPRVQAAMDSGKPYIVEYTEDGKPLELVITQNGNLKMALGSYEKEPNHNHLLSTGNGEVALNAEQRSSPERVAEVLKYNFKHGCIDIGDKLALINYPAADRVFSENQIKDTLNKALKSSFKDIQLDAIKSPVMRGEWLQSIAANPKATEEIRQAAKNEMAERFGTPEPTVEQATEKIGVSSPEHEEKLATVADDDYERD